MQYIPSEVPFPVGYSLTENWINFKLLYNHEILKHNKAFRELDESLVTHLSYIPVIWVSPTPNDRFKYPLDMSKYHILTGLDFFDNRYLIFDFTRYKSLCNEVYKGVSLL